MRDSADLASDALPATAAWRHAGSREGFETVVIERAGDAGQRLLGHTAAVGADGEVWAVSYDLQLDALGRTRTAAVTSRDAGGSHRVEIAGDGLGSWTVDGQPRPDLDGCLDVDLESSSCTNAFPVRRLGLGVGAGAQAPAAWVRAVGLGVERLEQRYERVRLDDRKEVAGVAQRYRYDAPAFDFTTHVTFDAAGLVLDYPGIGHRAA